MFEPIIGTVLAYKQLIVIGLAITGLAFYTGVPNNMTAAATTISGIDIPDIEFPDLDFADLGPYAIIVEPELEEIEAELAEIEDLVNARLASIEDLINNRLENI
jgi:hypothetical protein